MIIKLYIKLILNYKYIDKIRGISKNYLLITIFYMNIIPIAPYDAGIILLKTKYISFQFKNHHY